MTDADDERGTLNLRDRDAVTALYRDAGPAIRSFLARYLGNQRAAEDVLQETFLELWRRPEGFNATRGTVRQYLFGIARRRAAQWHRDNPLAPDDEQRRPPIHAIDLSDVAAVRQALERLAPDARGLLWLREVEGYSYAELASAFDVPVGTIRSRLFSARMELRRIWRVGCGQPAGISR